MRARRLAAGFGRLSGPGAQIVAITLLPGTGFPLAVIFTVSTADEPSGAVERDACMSTSDSTTSWVTKRWVAAFNAPAPTRIRQVPSGGGAIGTVGGSTIGGREMAYAR